MSNDKVLVPRELLEDLLGSAQAEAADRRTGLGSFRPHIQAALDKVVADTAALLAQPSDAALTNEPFCYTTPGMVEVAKAIKAGSGVGRIGAKLVKDARFCVPLHLSPPAPASVVLPVRAAAYGNRLQEWYTTGWNACLDRVKELNS